MEEIYVKVKNKLVVNAVSKLLEQILKKKVGHDIDIQINEAEATIHGSKAHVHLDIDLEMSTAELKEILGI